MVDGVLSKTAALPAGQELANIKASSTMVSTTPRDGFTYLYDGFVFKAMGRYKGLRFLTTARLFMTALQASSKHAAAQSTFLLPVVPGRCLKAIIVMSVEVIGRHFPYLKFTLSSSQAMLS